MVDMGRVVELRCSLRGGPVSARGSGILLEAVNAEFPALTAGFARNPSLRDYSAKCGEVSGKDSKRIGGLARGISRG